MVVSSENFCSVQAEERSLQLTARSRLVVITVAAERSTPGAEHPGTALPSAPMAEIKTHQHEGTNKSPGPEVTWGRIRAIQADESVANTHCAGGVEVGVSWLCGTACALETGKKRLREVKFGFCKSFRGAKHPLLVQGLS